MKKQLFITIILAIFISELYSQTFIPSMKKTVAFLFISDKNGKPKPIGTGFFVKKDTITHQGEIGLFLVTAKHVLLDDNNEIYKTIYSRANEFNGKAGYTRYNIILGTNTFFHRDSTVDLALIAGIPSNDKFDIKTVAENQFVTRDELTKGKIVEGCDIMYSGLFTNHIGDSLNYPVVRFGKIALISKERINWDKHFSDLVLVESTVYGGNSGSPAHVARIKDTNANTWPFEADEFKLLGVMIGYFFNPSTLGVVKTKVIPISKDNIGISAVVPAYYIQEMFNYEEVIKAALE